MIAYALPDCTMTPGSKPGLSEIILTLNQCLRTVQEYAHAPRKVSVSSLLVMRMILRNDSSM